MLGPRLRDSHLLLARLASCRGEEADFTQPSLVELTVVQVDGETREPGVDLHVEVDEGDDRKDSGGDARRDDDRPGRASGDQVPVVVIRSAAGGILPAVKASSVVMLPSVKYWLYTSAWSTQ